MNKMKKVKNQDDVVDIEEMNPVWLKDKGKYVKWIMPKYRCVSSFKVECSISLKEQFHIFIRFIS